MSGNIGNLNQRHLTDADEVAMLKLWRDGRDTLDIARAMQLPESVVYARLPLIREYVRQDQEWNFDRATGE